MCTALLHSSNVTYDEVIQTLIAARGSRTLEAVGKDLGLSGKGALGNWERQDRQVKLDDLVRWADLLGLDLRVTIQPKGGAPPTSQSKAAEAALRADEADAVLLLRLAKILERLTQLEMEDRSAIRSYFRALEIDLQEKEEAAAKVRKKKA